ncbi:hypothetical protein LP420_03145 [Massilia sp. B-10]|nr:hypothetical protein LP420_03145 [Massilia sp. B-10]
MIASDFPLWRRIVLGSCCGVCVDPMDPAAIAQAVDHLVSHPELARDGTERTARHSRDLQLADRIGQAHCLVCRSLMPGANCAACCAPS